MLRCEMICLRYLRFHCGATQDLASPLHFAAFRRRLEVAKLLLEKGADKEAKDKARGVQGHRRVAVLLRLYRTAAAVQHELMSLSSSAPAFCTIHSSGRPRCTTRHLASMWKWRSFCWTAARTRTRGGGCVLATSSADVMLSWWRGLLRREEERQEIANLSFARRREVVTKSIASLGLERGDGGEELVCASNHSKKRPAR